MRGLLRKGRFLQLFFKLFYFNGLGVAKPCCNMIEDFVIEFRSSS